MSTQHVALESGGRAIAPAWATTGWQSYRINFPVGEDWSDTTVTVSSCWGGGNAGRDLWGWLGGAGVAHGEVKSDGTRYYFEYSLQSGVGSSPDVAAVFRLVRRGAHYVGSVSFRI